MSELLHIINIFYIIIFTKNYYLQQYLLFIGIIIICNSSALFHFFIKYFLNIENSFFRDTI